MSFSSEFEKQAYMAPLLAGAARLAAPLLNRGVAAMAASKIAIPATIEAGKKAIMSAAPKIGGAIASGAGKFAGKMATETAGSMAANALTAGKKDVGTAAGSLMG